MREAPRAAARQHEAHAGARRLVRLVLRGCAPIHADRLIASAFGVHAVELVAQGKFDRMVAWSNRQVIDVPIEEAIASYQIVERDGALVRTARARYSRMRDT